MKFGLLANFGAPRLHLCLDLGASFFAASRIVPVFTPSCRWIYGIGSDTFDSLQASFFFLSFAFSALTFFTGLDPMKRAADGPRMTQANDASELMRTLPGRSGFLPGLGRSMMGMWPSSARLVHRRLDGGWRRRRAPQSFRWENRKCRAASFQRRCTARRDGLW